MKKLFLLFLMFHMVSQASSIIHKTIPYIGNPGSKAATIHAASGMKNVDLSKLASDYWNHLKTKEGDYYLYSLITDETLKHGNKRFGLTAEDVEQIKRFIEMFRMFEDVEYFSFSVLPEWLQGIYQDKQSQILDELCKHEKVDSLIPENLRGAGQKGLIEYIIQDYYKTRDGYKKYIYVKQSHILSSGFLNKKIEEFSRILRSTIDYFIAIQNLKDSSVDKDTRIVIPAHLFTDQKLLNNLRTTLQDQEGGNSEAVVIIAFDDTVKSIPNNFNIPNSPDIQSLIKHLVITGSGLQLVENRFLSGCIGLTSLELPAGLTQVRDDFLSGCIGLTSLELPAGLTQVRDDFLSGCRGLTSLELPAGLTKVGDSFLSGCRGLTSLKLPAGLTKVRDNFLYGCSRLISLELPAGLTKVGDNFLYECIGLTSLELPAVLQEVGGNFLFDCSGLTSLELPAGLTKVGDVFLYRCRGLTSLELPAGLQEVGDSFLSGCSGLRNLQLPNRLKQVGNYFLNGCSGLRSLQFRNKLRQVDNDFLSGCTGLRVVFMDKNLYTNLVKNNYVAPEIAGKIRYNSELMTYQEFKDKLLDPSDWDYLLNNQEDWHIENCIYLQDHQLKVDELDNLLKSFLKIKSNKEDIQNKKELMIILTNVLAKLENK